MENKKLIDEQAEKATISILLSYPKETRIYLNKIKDDYFFNPVCSLIFKAIKELTRENQAVEIITIAKKTNLKTFILTDIINHYQSFFSSLDSYIAIIKEYANRRWFYFRTEKLKKADKIEKEMATLSVEINNRLKDNVAELSDIKSIISEFSEYQEENKKHFESGNKYIGIPCGYSTIDNLISGIRKGHYWVVSAYTSTGKSAFLLNIASHILNLGKRILFFSLEMSRIQNVARILGIRTGITPTDIESGTLQFNRLEEEIEAKAVLYEQKINIYTTKRHIDDIIITIMAEHSTEPLDAVFIDYLQKIQNNASTRYERYTISSDKLQNLSQELKIPIIIASQIDNDSAKNHNDDIISVKGSGDVAGDVDLAILLRKNKEDERKLDGIIQKNRHGQRGKFSLRFFSGGQLLEESF